MFDVKTGVIPNSRDFVSTNTETRYVEDISRNKDMVEFCVALIIYVSSATASSTRLRMHTVMHNDCIHPDTNMLWETARPSFRMLQSILRIVIYRLIQMSVIASSM